jgi:hypothetical protein
VSAPVAADALGPLCWTAPDLESNDRWRLEGGPGVIADARRLARWARSTRVPVDDLHVGVVETPAIDELATRVATELEQGFGIAWIRGLDALDEPSLRLVYLAIGLRIGTTIDTYGRLYDVVDSQRSYRDNPIPVSQTRESTGMHTDSSGKDVWPAVIGLACVRPAPQGGRTRVVSAGTAHETVRQSGIELLERLYRPFARDVVTPGGDRSRAAIAANAFPVFRPGTPLAMRYMRFWIERAHEHLSTPLDAMDITRPRIRHDLR